ncbi:VOC family protein [Cytobacillus purgationiresistens]|uniref:Ornithine monooxygenase n=1 Tax=Cytobacillus purgationiresistens TaxID=863449 RepID=A0ABU0AJI5_9BACI|nr:VOC family protein [Cytobacillus purgationiresistens]MDQ0270573.1 hypothetical protein [Cytobacillus purgationiresistens]
MIFEMTYQIRVADFAEGFSWYCTFLDRQPDFIPHEGFAEWELIPGCWLQLAEGETAEGSGPIRLGVTDIAGEMNRLISLLAIDPFEIYQREEVPVKWGTFSDPWGNRLGMFEYLNKTEEAERIETIIYK